MIGTRWIEEGLLLESVVVRGGKPGGEGGGGGGRREGKGPDRSGEEVAEYQSMDGGEGGVHIKDICSNLGRITNSGPDVTRIVNNRKDDFYVNIFFFSFDIGIPIISSLRLAYLVTYARKTVH